MAEYHKFVYGFPVRREYPFNHRDTGHGAEPRTDWQDIFALSQGLTPVPMWTSSQLYVHGRHVDRETEFNVIKGPRLRYEEAVQELIKKFAGWHILVSDVYDEKEFYVASLTPNLNEDRDSAFAPIPDLTVPEDVREMGWRFCAAMNIDYEEPSWMLVYSRHVD
jgi:hypothetical protein